MGGLAIPLLEGVAVRVLTALGVGVAAGTAGEAVKEAARKRQEEADRARASPIARTDAQTKAKAKEKCKECPPDKGVPYQRNFPERKAWIDYQARITGMPNGPTFIMEWAFNGVVFDGFVSAQCLLQDAKAGYDQFFDMWGEFKYDFQERIFRDMMFDAIKQNNAAVPKPPVQLRWYFQEPVSYRYMQPVLQAAAPQIEVIYQP
jgi:Restriction endonuclease fold toxin 5